MLLECQNKLGLCKIQFCQLSASPQLEEFELIEALPSLNYISKGMSSKNASSAPQGLAKVESRPDWVSGGSCRKKGSAANGGVEELRQRMGPQPRFTGGNASGYFSAGARKSEPWNEAESWKRRGAGCLCRETELCVCSEQQKQSELQNMPPGSTSPPRAVVRPAFNDLPA